MPADREKRIPPKWCTAVADILEDGRLGIEILSKYERADKIWREKFSHDLNTRSAAMAAALRKHGLQGREFLGLYPKGTAQVYDFHFDYYDEDRNILHEDIYGKIALLLPERKIIVIHSSHYDDD
jgi:hypothetical protein